VKKCLAQRQGEEEYRTDNEKEGSLVEFITSGVGKVF
jgi:hypothetical protein